MIYTDRQRAFTLEWIDQFERSIAEMRRSPGPGDTYEPEMREIIIRSNESWVEDLQGQITEYDALRSGKVKRLKIDTFDDFGKGLARARIAAGVTHEQLAKLLGVTVNEIEDYERFDYERAPLFRLVEIARAIGAEIRAGVRLTDRSDAKKSAARKRAATLAAD